MLNAKNALTNLMENAPVYRDFNSPSFTTTTGAATYTAGDFKFRVHYLKS